MALMAAGFAEFHPSEAFVAVVGLAVLIVIYFSFSSGSRTD
jgi:hypothetical protein